MKFKKSLGAFLVPLLSILLAFVIGGIIMAALGADPFLAVKYLFQGAFGSKAGIGTTLAKATPLMFTALPVVCGLNAGHALPRCIVPLGVPARVDVQAQKIEFL